MIRRSELSRNKPGNDRLADKGKLERNTLFYWIPAIPVVPDKVGDNWDGGNDGGGDDYASAAGA